MYGALKSAVFRLPNVSSSSFHCNVTGRLSASVPSLRKFAIRTDFSETVYDNEDGGPKCRGIELLRDPNFNKASNGAEDLSEPIFGVVRFVTISVIQVAKDDSPFLYMLTDRMYVIIYCVCVCVCL